MLDYFIFFVNIKNTRILNREVSWKTHNGYKIRRKDRKCSTLTPGKWIGFSRLLPTILLSVCVCGSENMASKGVSGMLKPFLRTLKSVFSTFWKKIMLKWHFSSCEDLKTGKYTSNTTSWKSKSLSRWEAGFSMLGPAEAWGSLVGLHVKRQRKTRGRLADSETSGPVISLLFLPVTELYTRTECH